MKGAELPVINRTPVDGANELFFLESPAMVAPGCQGCEALSLPKVKAGCYVIGGYIQHNMFQDMDPGKPDMSRANIERVREEHKSRAQAGIDGSCGFAEQIDNCWRRA